MVHSAMQDEGGIDLLAGRYPVIELRARLWLASV